MVLACGSRQATDEAIISSVLSTISPRTALPKTFGPHPVIAQSHSLMEVSEGVPAVGVGVHSARLELGLTVRGRLGLGLTVRGWGWGYSAVTV